MTQIVAETRKGTIPVCDTCCTDGVLYMENGCCVWDCPLHLRVVIENGEVVAAETRGLRS